MFSWICLVVTLVFCQLQRMNNAQDVESTPFVMGTTLKPPKSNTGIFVSSKRVDNSRFDFFQAEPGCYLATFDPNSPMHGDMTERRPLVYSILEECSLLQCAQECGAAVYCAGYAFSKYSADFKTRGRRRGICRVVKSVPVNESDLVVVCQQDAQVIQSAEIMYKKVGFDERKEFVAHEVNDTCFNGGSWDGSRCQCTGSWVGHHCDTRPKDCWDLHHDRLPGSLPAGLYHYVIQPEGSGELMEVVCNQGWTYIQRRAPYESCNHISFYQPWDIYREGFGSLDCDFWLGNENIHALTSQPGRRFQLDVEVCLQIDVTSGGCEMKHARYDLVEVVEEGDGYELILGSYVHPPWIDIGGVAQPKWREAGDALRLHTTPLADEPTASPQPQHSQNNMEFSTFDHDNDNSDGNCAEKFEAGWWFNNCTSANPNGPRIMTNDGIREAGEVSIFWKTPMENFTLDTYTVAGIALRVRPVNVGDFP